MVCKKIVLVAKTRHSDTTSDSHTLKKSNICPSGTRMHWNIFVGFKTHLPSLPSYTHIDYRYLSSILAHSLISQASKFKHGAQHCK